MGWDDEIFEPRLGRMRSVRSRRGRKYLHAVLAAAARAGMPKRSGRRFLGSRIGRGAVAARALGARDRFAGLRARRAIVKTRLVRLGGKALAAARAHLRYIQRDGVTREGEPGRLYSAADDVADGKAFIERCSGDRHQFRFIVSAEDGAEYEDLRPLVRRFMARMEEDLGTRLDWVAADHVDTGHPHTHIMLRGKDEQGENLVIAPDYIKRGMRERVAELVSLDLGPRTDLEIQRRLRLDVGAERLTAIDRRLLRDMDRERTVAGSGRSMFDHAVRTGRLRKLEALGLAEKLAGGRWRLDDDLEARLRALGERSDIIRTMQRALTAAGVERAPGEQIVFRAEAGASITGRVIARGLADELRDRHYLVIDGLDGRSHYIDIGKGDGVEPLPPGSIVRVSPRRVVAREVDERIAAIAAENGGRYSIALHAAAEPGASAEFARAHVRRLEAVRRSAGGGIERADDGSWSVPADSLELARRHEQSRTRARPVEVELLSAVPLERLPDAQGATWLDRKPLGEDAEGVRDSGFGREVASALAVRRAWLVEQGLAREEQGVTHFAPDLLARLERRELLRTAERLGKESGKPFTELEPGMHIEGVVRRRLDLVSGRFALVENSREFVLVPWKPVLQRAIGREVSGLVRQRAGISWSFGRERGMEI
jgi:type IV secretory pathway VirD2 relaxase